MATWDHGGGCACGLSRFCDCSNATAQDRKDREDYDKWRKKEDGWKKPLHTARDMVVKENPMALKQVEGSYNEGIRSPPPNNAGSMMSLFDEKPPGEVTITVLDMGNLKLSMSSDGLTMSINVPMPAEVRKGIERLRKAAGAR